jgi:heterodisulfide reductase subunit B
MKKEIPLYEIPEKFAEHIAEVCGSTSVSFEQYMEACGGLSLYNVRKHIILKS